MKCQVDEAQAGTKTAGRNINNLRYADDNTLMAKSKEELKSLMISVKEENGKAGLKLNIQKTKIMASSPITSWQIDGETMEQWQTIFSCAPKSLQTVTAAMKLKDTCQSRLHARYWMLGAGGLGRPRGMVWGGRREEGSGWGTHVYLGQIHFDIWQN